MTGIRMTMRPDHAIWVISQQIFVRGIVACKFLLAARLLGPELIGLVGIATLALAIVESLSDTGMAQAVIQRRCVINPEEAGAVWTLQMSRGSLLAIVLAVFSVPIALLFKVPDSANLVALAAVMPFLRNAINPGVFLAQRNRNFRDMTIYESSAAALDIASTFVYIYLGFGAASILLGNITSDCLKLFLSWTWLKTPVNPSFHWALLHDLNSFGKWVWGTSVVTLVLNQADKVLVARFLGTTEFGLYQVASRIAQLFVADGATALGQYLYPNFANRHRTSQQEARQYFNWVIRRLIPAAAIIAILLIAGADLLVSTLLGPQWSAAVPLLRALVAPMFLGAVIAILVAYLRGIGAPRSVTEATLFQLLTLVIAAPVLLYYFSAIGMASSLAIAGSVAVGYMFYAIRRHK